MYEHFDNTSYPIRFAPEPQWMGQTPYEEELEDLVGNEGTVVVRTCYEIGERIEDDFEDDFIQTEIGLEGARNRFEELVEKAREAFDRYEAKLEDINQRYRHGRC